MIKLEELIVVAYVTWAIHHEWPSMATWQRVYVVIVQLVIVAIFAAGVRDQRRERKEARRGRAPLDP